MAMAIDIAEVIDCRECLFNSVHVRNIYDCMVIALHFIKMISWSFHKENFTFIQPIVVPYFGQVI